MLQASRPAAIALLTYLLALPATVVLAAAVPVGFLLSQESLTFPALAGLGTLVVSIGLALKGHAHNRTEQGLLPIQMAAVLLAAFTSQSGVAMCALWALSCTLALAVPVRFALPIAVAVMQISAGILLTTLTGGSTAELLGMVLGPGLFLLPPQTRGVRTRPFLRALAAGLTGLSLLLLALQAFQR
ncbi:hypothetical protein [Deinococcus multiflagellatus]|uniref:Uncharacterized protein n=1 Tax=Deinococcus multiflagellatus TaxID=1656887 RepID=A0ABW1ZQ34_9DEIO|nr:hypothetical protein [Deinococcus multiflagellatus]MBZ9714903.1 hypothetical protein [Deinococcus multiflagellatus]